MAVVEVLMPKMGESITDATIIKWHKKVGDTIADEETLLEVATDKVDSEIPSPESGIITEILFGEDDVVDVGTVIAIIETDTKASLPPSKKSKKNKSASELPKEAAKVYDKKTEIVKVKKKSTPTQNISSRFYSPLVKSIAKKEGIPLRDLESIEGTGAKGRLTKSDLIAYINSGKKGTTSTTSQKSTGLEESNVSSINLPKAANIVSSDGDEIIVMDRMRKLIADHMVQSKKISPHVTSFAEADVTRLFDWRARAKEAFLKKYGIKLTLTPIILEIVAKALRLHPKLNSSVMEDKMVVKKNINIGMATALPSGNLIVPVIHNADQFNLNGLAMKVNEKVEKARTNSLSLDEIQNGTFTLTNIGTYGSQLGTPIINQPQVAILATGAIKKKPVVIESPDGDAIGIRKMMYLSMSYDHRVIDGFLGGTFLQTVIQLLENFDENREI